MQTASLAALLAATLLRKLLRQAFGERLARLELFSHLGERASLRSVGVKTSDLLLERFDLLAQLLRVTRRLLNAAGSLLHKRGIEARKTLGEGFDLIS